MFGFKSGALALSFVLILAYFSKIAAQYSIEIDTSRRLKTTMILGGSFYTGTLATCYYLWYRDTPGRSFHWLNDNHTWLQLDKAGHLTTSYTFSDYSYNMLRWSGLNNKKASIYGGLIGFGTLTTIEIFDGFHSKWGASWGDMIANATGPILFSSQQLIWQEQRIRMKFSYIPSDKYAPLNPATLGENHISRVFSDYNSQTYWLSANIASFSLDNTFVPKWLNVAFGYGGRGLAVPPLLDGSGNVMPDYVRTREYYLSLDVDFQKIPTNSKFLKSVFKTISFIKFPFPAIGYNKVDRFNLSWM